MTAAPAVETPTERASDPAAPDGAPPRPGRRLVRRYWPIGLLVVGMALVGIVVARNASSDLPLDPRSTAADGTKAVALILEEVGADVTLLESTDRLEVDTLLILVDNLGDASVAQVQAFVQGGGRVLVADSSGRLSEELRPAGTAAGMFQPALDRNCDVPALADVERVRTGGAVMHVIPDGADGCFGQDEAAWLIIEDRGDGTQMTTGSPIFLLNSFIGEVDNAPLAVALLAPEPGTRVGIVRPTFAGGPGSEGDTLFDLIPPGVRAALGQLTIAFVFLVLWRMRRLGKPVDEPQAVRLAGSEIVVAMGNLFQRSGSRQRAGELLRDDFRRTVTARLGLPADLPVADMAEVVASRTGVDAHRVSAALQGPPPATDAELVALTQELEQLRDATLMSATATGAHRADRQ